MPLNKCAGNHNYREAILLGLSVIPQLHVFNNVSVCDYASSYLIKPWQLQNKILGENSNPNVWCSWLLNQFLGELELIFSVHNVQTLTMILQIKYSSITPLQVLYNCNSSSPLKNLFPTLLSTSQTISNRTFFFIISCIGSIHMPSTNG